MGLSSRNMLCILFPFRWRRGPSKAFLFLELLWQVLAFTFFAVCDGYKDVSDWDYLIFSQKWPTSFCIHYKDGNPTRTCILPEDQSEWSIHGIWPSRFKGENPAFCDADLPYDSEKIAPIRARLQRLWPNLEGDKSADSLWEHEWTKHGTCAFGFEPLSGELKYFEGGLNLYATYNMTSLLQRMNFLPDRNKMYNVRKIVGRIRKALKKIPNVTCIKEIKSQKFYLSEIRLCFNKSLKLIDCGNSASFEHLLGALYSRTNCPVNGNVIYPDAESFLAGRADLEDEQVLTNQF